MDVGRAFNNFTNVLKMKKLLLLFCILLPILGNAQMECSTPFSQPSQVPSNCNSLVGINYADNYPIITVDVAIHFIDVGNGNFYDGSTSDWNSMNGTTNAILLIDKSNVYLMNMIKNPIQNKHFLGDSRIRYKIYSNYDDGVFFWDSEQDYTPVPNVVNVKIRGFYDPNRPCDPLYPNGKKCPFFLKGATTFGANWMNIDGWQESEIFGGPYHFWNYANLMNHCQYAAPLCSLCQEFVLCINRGSNLFRITCIFTKRSTN